MKCTHCNTKSCRGLEECNALKVASSEILTEYHKEENQQMVKSASRLIDDGRAGTLSRMQELVDFIKSMKFTKVALAYCYGMEKQAMKVSKYFKEYGINISTVSCTAGALGQNEINLSSKYSGVSCNPICQAEQLNAENIELTITMGLCLGHDIIFNKYINSYTTNLVVKDRVYSHNPMTEINQIV